MSVKQLATGTKVYSFETQSSQIYHLHHEAAAASSPPQGSRSIHCVSSSLLPSGKQARRSVTTLAQRCISTRFIATDSRPSAHRNPGVFICATRARCHSSADSARLHTLPLLQAASFGSKRHVSSARGIIHAIGGLHAFFAPGAPHGRLGPSSPAMNSRDTVHNVFLAWLVLVPLSRAVVAQEVRSVGFVRVINCCKPLPV